MPPPIPGDDAVPRAVGVRRATTRRVPTVLARRDPTRARCSAPETRQIPRNLRQFPPFITASTSVNSRPSFGLIRRARAPHMSRASLALCLAANHLRLFAPAASSASSRTWRRKDLNPFVDRARDASSVTRFPACGRAVPGASGGAKKTRHRRRRHGVAPEGRGSARAHRAVVRGTRRVLQVRRANAPAPPLDSVVARTPRERRPTRRSDSILRPAPTNERAGTRPS